MKKIAIVGSRDWPDPEEITRYLHQFSPLHTEIVTGGASGADTAAILWAKGNRSTLTVIRPDWNKHGKAAGPMRNREIVEYSDEVVAFWDGKSRGTKSTIDLALANRKKLTVIFPTPPAGEE